MAMLNGFRGALFAAKNPKQVKEQQKSDQEEATENEKENKTQDEGELIFFHTILSYVVLEMPLNIQILLTMIVYRFRDHKRMINIHYKLDLEDLDGSVLAVRRAFGL